MTDKSESAIEAITSRVLELESELEAEGTASTRRDTVEPLRQVLHAWVETVTAVVTSPSVGRVVLIHANGRESRIASPDLPALLSRPITWDPPMGE